MMEITAALVKVLRARTGSGLMECKRALQEASGDIEAAVEIMRKSGQAKADNKASRIAMEGLIAIKQIVGKIVMVETNCETDFVTKNSDFRNFVNVVLDTAISNQVVDLETLLSSKISNRDSVEQTRQHCVAKIGENIIVRRFARFISAKGVLGYYLHGTRIGVLVELDGGDTELAKDISMHIAASRPLCISTEQVPAEIISKEQEIYAAQASETARGKPANIVDKIVSKIVEGRLRKYLESVTLLGQNFVKNPDQSVAELLSSRRARIIRFQRFELGEGIEKNQPIFCDSMALE
jgi:elongation factor Ts